MTPLQYYAEHGAISDPGEDGPLLDGLPTKLDELVGVVQGLVVHLHWASRYGLDLSEERRQEGQLRSVPRILARVGELDGRPLVLARPPDRRVVGTCRDFSVLLTTMLRNQGVPARARCGFGAYFTPTHFEDHWVCEYWNAAEARWVLVDAQLDELQRDALQISFDTLDVPRDQFIVGGRAWQWCRAGEADPERFGIFDERGMPFVVGSLVRDLAALNKIEMLPWDDDWAPMVADGEEISPDKLPLLDHIADMTLAVDTRWSEMRVLFDAEPRLHP